MPKPTSSRTLPEIVKRALADMQPLMDELVDTMSPHQRHAQLFVKLVTWYGILQHDCAPFLKGLSLPRAARLRQSVIRPRLRPLPPVEPGA
jgi:hypothetical protein